MTTYKTGDKIRIVDCGDGKTLPGTVSLASSDSKSLLLEFEGIIAGYVACMPVLMTDDGDFRTLHGTPIFISNWKD